MNSLYKTVLEEGKITSARVTQLLKDYDELTTLYKAETDKSFKLDQKNQELSGHITELEQEIARLKLQKFTLAESIVFLVRAIKGGDSA